MKTPPLLRCTLSLICVSALAACGSDRAGGASSSVAGSGNPTAPSGQDVLSLDFSANRNVATAGDSVVLEWRTQAGSTCEASGDWKGSKAATAMEMLPLQDARNYVFTLTCKNGNASVARSVMVDVQAAQIKPVTQSAEDKEIQKVFKQIQEFDKV